MPRYCQTFHTSRRPLPCRVIGRRQTLSFSLSEVSLTFPIVMELIDSSARDGQGCEQPVHPRSIGLRGETILGWPSGGKPCLASRSWALSKISLLFTRPAGLRCARFGLGLGQILKSWRVSLSSGHASRPSSVIKMLRIACHPVI